MEILIAAVVMIVAIWTKTYINELRRRIVLLEGELQCDNFPSKFMREGVPNYQALTDAYVALEKKLGTTKRVPAGTK